MLYIPRRSNNELPYMFKKGKQVDMFLEMTNDAYSAVLY